ncbi:response regulator transcription factor [Opitutus sp. GAS368]|jgi:DNA-binding NarL/FixJ family response regulator|uniref:response regulator transcription factor n=1 Tax=Opitutus sp. GAS368 TaxID=1882749 RepID=UPI00087C7281|nr:response regulator transcription factor [Opitutus sp. GAS368]SDR67439.1 DNA-binding response regulator, NarL/FixJ family, contains REC and HTH domains [Opitutus sp. GAS368]
MSPSTILCIEDNALLLDFLVLKLEQVVSGPAVIVGAGSGRAGLELAREHKPDVVILELRLPDMNGFQVAAELAGLRPAPRVLVVTSSAPDTVLSRITNSPIHGFLLKSSARDSELALALKELLFGRTYFQPAVLTAIARTRRQPDHFSKILSDRELELVPLFGFGWAHDKVARHAGLSPATVRTHHQNILAKLNLHGREELMRWAIKKGFTDFRYEPGEAALGCLE